MSTIKFLCTILVGFLLVNAQLTASESKEQEKREMSVAKSNCNAKDLDMCQHLQRKLYTSKQLAVCEVILFLGQYGKTAVEDLIKEYRYRDREAFLLSKMHSPAIKKIMTTVDTHDKALKEFANTCQKQVLETLEITEEQIKKCKGCDFQEQNKKFVESMHQRLYKNICEILAGEDEKIEKALMTLYKDIKGLPPIEVKSPDYTMSVQSYLNFYRDNGVAADEKFKGKLIQLSGYVGNVENNLWDSGATLSLHSKRSEYDFESVEVKFRNTKALKYLARGHYITVIGIGDGCFMASYCTIKNAKVIV